MSGAKRVAVVGGGMLGCAAAARLASEGHGVTLIEQGRIAGGTTGASFAWLNATAKWDDEAYFRLNARGLAAWTALAREIGPDAIGFGGCGALLWADDAAGATAHALRAQVEGLQALGHGARWLDTEGLALAAPEVRFPGGACGLIAPDDRLLDAPTAARAMVDRLIAAGGMVREDVRVTGFERASDGRIAALRTTAGTIGAETIVLAAGTATGTLAGLALGPEGAACVPLDLVPGLLVDTPPVPEAARTGFALHAEGPGSWHARTLPGGGLRLGAEDTDAGVAARRGQLDARDLTRTLIGRAARCLPALPDPEALLQGSTWRIGVRPIPRDGRPIVGPLPGAANLFAAVTHSGVTLALTIAEGLAAWIADGRAPADLERYRPDRFLAGRA